MLACNSINLSFCISVLIKNKKNVVEAPLNRSNALIHSGIESDVELFSTGRFVLQI